MALSINSIVARTHQGVYRECPMAIGEPHSQHGGVPQGIVAQHQLHRHRAELAADAAGAHLRRGAATDRPGLALHAPHRPRLPPRKRPWHLRVRGQKWGDCLDGELLHEGAGVQAGGGHGCDRGHDSVLLVRAGVGVVQVHSGVAGVLQARDDKHHQELCVRVQERGLLLPGG